MPRRVGYIPLYTQSQIDPLISLRNSPREAARGTLINLQRKSPAIGGNTPYPFVQLSEVLDVLILHFGSNVAHSTRAVAVNLVNTVADAVVA